MNWDAFFEVHKNLPREGPGTPADVLWALDWIMAAHGAKPRRILDAACGTGADTQTFATHYPDATITAIDQVAHFTQSTQARLAAHGARIRIRTGDMFALEGPFDLIWCAGAAYFAGVTETLCRFRPMLAPRGYVVFSEPIRPGAEAPKAAHLFWEDYTEIADPAGVAARIAAAGFHVCAERDLIGAPWAAYYDPLQARIDTLRQAAPNAELSGMLDLCQREIDLWRAAAAHILYRLFIVKPDAG